MLIDTTSRKSQTHLRSAITQAYRQNEDIIVNYLLDNIHFTPEQLEDIEQNARALVIKVREQRLGKGGLDAFLYQYDLSSEEGIALMCLAEALLRIPDNETIDKLIQEKMTSANWRENMGRSDSLFVNAATWGLMLTGKILSPQKNNNYFTQVLKNIVQKTGEPVIRKIISEAMKMLGKQFILGRTIDEALERAKNPEKRGYRHSYDMLGEAALTVQDAERYFVAYQNAIEAIGKSNDKGPADGPGISIKLSALYPRYEYSKKEESVKELSKKLLALSRQAKKYNMGLTVDAEESHRLEISLDIIENVFSHPDLKGWDGFGLAVQAYQKRASFVIDWLIDLAKRHDRRLMIRLVKGAYWDTEIKDSQVRGLENYPVFTRKMNTDLSYLVCAQKLINAGKIIFPQFATHNAQTVSAVMAMMKSDQDFEFQCLQGMGNTLYDPIVDLEEYGYPSRVYAPVGSHQDLLPYLVRRLLENGANSSFVNRIVDENEPIEELIANPIDSVKALHHIPHPLIPLPKDIYGPLRQNSKGVDFSNIELCLTLADEMDKFKDTQWLANPTFIENKEKGNRITLVEPRNNAQKIGEVIEGTREDVEIALSRAQKAQFAWSQRSVQERALCLQKAAELFEKHRSELMVLLIREAGKTVLDALSEIREAVDFCRYYAEEACHSLVIRRLPGPTGEWNELQMHGRGIIACISPWNFPLAIFTGQVVASIISGNAVIAKPAHQTPLIAARAVELFHEAGIPKEIVQLMPGKGSVVGNALIEDERIKGVLFTGSTDTARMINLTLANRKGPITPFIAETGGQNCMIVDSSALAEQVVKDVITSCFQSAGQRCSALRVLCLQSDIADKVITMLEGAMAEIKVGDPAFLSTDVGPVIDNSARKELQAHIEKMKNSAKLIYEINLPAHLNEGSFLAPIAFEINNISLLEKEVFGPVLHVLRFKRNELDKLIESINNTGFGLTLGIHSRIEEVVSYIQDRIKAGNAYVNRNMIGAVVGVQPFGGEGLSGTGPKAGGPHYLSRLCVERTLSIDTTAAGGNASLLSMSD